MATDNDRAPRHQLDFMLYDLVPTMLRIDFPTGAGAEAFMPVGMPMIRIGALSSDTALVINSLSIQPRRIEFEIARAPAQLPISVQIAARGPFVFGWLQVPDNVRSLIVTAAQRIRIIGPGYWALPLGEGLPEPDPKPETRERESPSNSAAAKPAEKPPETKPGPTPVPGKATTGSTTS